MRFPPVVRFAFSVLAGSLLLALAGCGPTKTAVQGPVFFPPAPSLPRLQFLTGISNSDDVEGKTSNVSLFAYGEKARKRAHPILKPHGITAANGKVYVADIAGQVVILDLPKKSFELLKGNKGGGKLKQPVSVAIDEGGLIYVADVARKEVLIYDQEGEFLKAMGSGLNIAPTDLAVDFERVYLLDTKGAVIKVLDRVTGEFIMDIGKGFPAESRLFLPTNFVLEKNGIIRVTNAGNGKIISCDRDGNFVGSFGELGDGFGQFSRPKGITVDDNEEIFVVDGGFQNVQMFNEKGRILTYFGGNKLVVGGLNLPSGIAVSTDNIPYFQTLAAADFQVDHVIFVTNQFGDPRVSIYGFGKRKGIDYDLEYKKLREENEKKARDAIEKANQLAAEKAKAEADKEKAAAKPETAPAKPETAPAKPEPITPKPEPVPPKLGAEPR